MKNYSFANVKTRTFPKISEIQNPYIFGGIKSVINVSEKEDENLKQEYLKLGIDYHFFPTKEDYEINWESIKHATKKLLFNIKNKIPTIVHCIGGNNRSPMIVECAYFAINGTHLHDEYKGKYNHIIYNSQFINNDISALEEELKRLNGQPL